MDNLILAPYFTKRLGYSQHDSTNGGKGGSKPNDYGVMKEWYESVVKLKLHARVFHNELSDDFVNEHETDEIKFVLHDTFHRPSYNDERFYAYYRCLMSLPSVKMVMCTDLFDVKFMMDPFELMNDHEECQLFSGSETINPYSGKWMRKKCAAMNYRVACENYHVGNVMMNAGIIGGSRETLLKLFNQMKNDMETVELKHNANMPVYNRCVETTNLKVFTGYPLHNVFNSNRTDAGTYIKHK
jgi:hypothetical protein